MAVEIAVVSAGKPFVANLHANRRLGSTDLRRLQDLLPTGTGNGSVDDDIAGLAIACMTRVCAFMMLAAQLLPT